MLITQLKFPISNAYVLLSLLVNSLSNFDSLVDVTTDDVQIEMIEMTKMISDWSCIEAIENLHDYNDYSGW